MNLNKIFASSGSCFADTEIIKGKVEGVKFTSKEFTGTMDSQNFWDDLMEFAKTKEKYIILCSQ